MTFYSAGDDGLIKKWSLRDGKLKETFSRTPQGDPEAAGPKIFFIDFAVNESQLITGYSDGRIVVWNTKKKRIISTIEDNHRAAISLIVMSRDKSKVYTVSNSEDKSLKVWGYHKKRLILAIKNIHTGFHENCAYL